MPEPTAAAEVVPLVPAPPTTAEATPGGVSPQLAPAAPPPGSTQLPPLPEQYSDLYLDYAPEEAAGWEKFLREREAKKVAASAPPSPPPAPAAEVTPAREQTSHPESLTLRARQLGFSQELIGSLSTADLRSEVQQELQFRSLHRPQQQQQQQAARQPEAPAAAESLDDKLRRYGMDPDQWDDVTKGQLGAMVDKFDGRLAKLEQLNDRFAAAEETRAADQEWKLLDRFFEKHPHVYGKGPTAEMTDDDAGAEQRVTVRDRIRALVQSGRQSGKSVSALMADCEAVHKRLFGFAAPADPPPPPPADSITAGYGQPSAVAPVPTRDQTVETPHGVKDAKTGRFVRQDQSEHEARQRAWMDATSPAPTDRAEEQLPPGREKATRYLERRLRMLTAGDEKN